MSFFRRNHPHPDDLDNTDDENDETIDPDLRLRTVRTAASAIAESIQSERRAERRKGKKGSKFFRKTSDKKRTHTAESKDTTVSEASAKILGKRRNVYVNSPLPPAEMDHGEPIVRYARNKVRTSSEWSIYSCTDDWAVQNAKHISEYTFITFLPKNLFFQFQR
jgi:phospholipid-translocating ATPase